VRTFGTTGEIRTRSDLKDMRAAVAHYGD